MGAGFHSFQEPLRAAIAETQATLMLEWGPGLSTDIMLAAVTTRRVISIEHDPRYVADIEARLRGASGWSLVQMPCTNRDSSYATCALDIARDQGALFDLIFIDGRRRIECLLVALQIIRPGGLILLHDWCRTNYRRLADDLPHCEMLRVEHNTATMRRRN